jgi:membrane associated rhomboid family serine protease
VASISVPCPVKLRSRHPDSEATVLPIGDDPNPRGVHWMTILLIVVNVAVYLLVTLPMSGQAVNPADPRVAEYIAAISKQLPPGTNPAAVLAGMSQYDLFVYQWGFRPAAMNVTDLFFSMFLHGGFMHLFGNMLFLFIYGNNVEDRLGPFGFLAAYLLTGVAAALFQAAFNMNSNIPMVGASGAISGVLGFYLRWFPRHYVKVFMFLPPLFMGVRMFSASLVLWMYLILDNVLPFVLASQGGGGVAHGAHIGGFIAGFVAAVVMGRPRQGTPDQGIAR